MQTLLSSYNGGWYVCTGYNSELGHFGLRTVRSASYLPSDFVPLSSDSIIAYGAVRDVNNVYVHPNLRYNGIVVHMYGMPPDSLGELLIVQTSSLYDRPGNNEIHNLQSEYGDMSYEELLIADGWSCVDRQEYRKTAHVSELEYDTILGIDYFEQLNSNHD